MEISKIHICSIDRGASKIEVINNQVYGEELEEYLQELFEIVIAKSAGRRFKFNRVTTEVRARISDIIKEQFETPCNIISNRLLGVETEVQVRMKRMGVEIQKGILVQALIKVDGISKFIICKAEHNDFLDEVKYKPIKGLPIKKKAFKAFICDLVKIDSEEGIYVYDTNSTDTKYWWKEFLELTKMFSDERNTENAFDAIDKGFYTKIKNKFPEDYMYLRNSGVQYFRSREKFDINDFVDCTIGAYEPIDNGLKMDEWKKKVQDLRENKVRPFESQFNIVKEVVKARFINQIKLSNYIDLVLKQDYPTNDILAFEENGIKFIKIKTDHGYSLFKKSFNAKS